MPKKKEEKIKFVCSVDSDFNLDNIDLERCEEVRITPKQEESLATTGRDKFSFVPKNKEKEIVSKTSYYAKNTYFSKKTYFYLGFILFAISWASYLCTSPIFTVFILFLHYFSFFVMCKDLVKFEKSDRALAILAILFASILLDFYLYNPIHEIELSLYYYFCVNLTHISVLTLFFNMWAKETRLFVINIIVSSLNLYIWFYSDEFLWLSMVCSCVFLSLFFIHILMNKNKS